MPKFRKKPVVVEAERVTWENMNQVAEWCGALPPNRTDDAIEINTREGVMRAHAGDWVVKGEKGEFVAEKPDIFAATYEPVAHDKVAPQACPSCGGSGQVQTGPPLGTCDGPQFGTCSRCRGTGKID